MDSRFRTDNCTIYLAKFVPNWFEKHESGIRYITWPANSLNHNIIKNILDMLELSAKTKFVFMKSRFIIE